MPEGDSIYQLSHRLRFMEGRKVLGTSIRVPQLALATFTGRTVKRVWPYGKNLFMQIGEDILHTHLKMEGAWAVYRKGDRWSKPAHTARVQLLLDGTPQKRSIEVVGFSLGFVRIFPACDYPGAIAHLGPDVLGQSWENTGHSEARRRILLDPDRAIGLAILDQRNLAGVGNEYRAEICFLCGVHPATRVRDVDVDRILLITRRLMWANRLSTVRVTTGIKRLGETTYVFGRNHKPCRRCGTRILQSTLVDDPSSELERIIWWCPHCQPFYSEP
ncbi:DNA-formamidopyrimidine glycosylase family protein [Corynebacterium pseudotuberculosis]|uniref:DNA-(apurinic or apyrimidinic site) lyase n=1 Tax=Corynebacterium pseudotuberculosis (strain C231) TaxID=681645 RepID=D9Q993_CORP2|nr:DNA-formamidopyrimidine glycosylase family protein [Corynebacterium pseudotuberculosis]ADK28431.2 Fpg/Nei family DNA glycosylase [Corynebacterium pseudotuberculosis FRC41]ADL10119.2 Fpg/Nei family DNA glycosylase [Corynebacterium pseudotuberculosis C231]ADL20530.1 Fpg/Nei family DNA glycosylase [Corynebacterium pseudotuberculosis 1002]ADO25911.2 Fpg/Nei family DNA glycosylase [Corynebacterium pseudotuberculosis I19]AJC13374.1 DNA glycosylase [Corynebacterium pseudotuberculosis]